MAEVLPIAGSRLSEQLKALKIGVMIQVEMNPPYTRVTLILKTVKETGFYSPSVFIEIFTGIFLSTKFLVSSLYEIRYVINPAGRPNIMPASRKK